MFEFVFAPKIVYFHLSKLFIRYNEIFSIKKIKTPTFATINWQLVVANALKNCLLISFMFHIVLVDTITLYFLFLSTIRLCSLAYYVWSTTHLPQIILLLITYLFCYVTASWREKGDKGTMLLQLSTPLLVWLILLLMTFICLCLYTLEIPMFVKYHNIH